MRFFQRLAPSARMQHAVQPVLPPRFAGPGANHEELEGDWPAQPERAITPAARDPRPEPVVSDPDPVLAPAPAPAAPVIAARLAVPAAVQVAHAQTRIEANPTQPRPFEPPPAAPGTAPRSHATPASRLVQLPEPASAPAAAAALPQRPPRDHALAPPAPARPLSAHALAQRVPAAKGDSTVVHVTIDRIDVRAAAPAQAPRAQATPRPAPSTSLADYLRRGRS